MSSSKSSKVTVFHRINKLKLKAGIPLHDEVHGYIKPEDINKAQYAIDEKEKEYPIEVKIMLEKLEKTWEELKATSPDKRAKLLDKIYNFANNIKDITSTYDHDLMHHFSLSLRNFCEKINVEKQQHHTIVQAHLDVMWVTYDEKLRKDDSEKAQELKMVVAVAIKKYS